MRNEPWPQPSPTQAALVRDWKDAGRSEKYLPIITDKGVLIGSLLPMDDSVLAQAEDINLLVKWRQLYKKNFFTQFEVTCEGTRSWLANLIRNDPAQIFFFVCDSAGNKLGQYGIAGISPHQAELYGGIRGEKGGHPQLFFFAEVQAIHFCFDILKVGAAFTRAFADNIPALCWHRLIGMEITSVVSLYETHQESSVVYLPQAMGENQNQRQVITFSIGPEYFYRRYGWVRAQAAA